MPRLTPVWTSLLSFLLSCSLADYARASTEVRGRVFYDALSTKEPSFFLHTVDATKDGRRSVVTVYTDKEGKELIREENTFEGGKLLRSQYRQSQVNERGEVSFKDGKAQFTFTDYKGTENETEDVVPDMILGSMIGDHLITHWDDLLKGESVHVRYMAIERCETIGFKFFKEAERIVDGKTLVDFKMKPSSFIIAAIVDPIRITVTKDAPHYIVEVLGRTPIRWPKVFPPQGRKDWRAIDARIEMDPPKEIAEVAPAPIAETPPAPVPVPAKAKPKKAPARKH